MGHFLPIAASTTHLKSWNETPFSYPQQNLAKCLHGQNKQIRKWAFLSPWELWNKPVGVPFMSAKNFPMELHHLIHLYFNPIFSKTNFKKSQLTWSYGFLISISQSIPLMLPFILWVNDLIWDEDIQDLSTFHKRVLVVRHMDEHVEIFWWNIAEKSCIGWSRHEIWGGDTVCPMFLIFSPFITDNLAISQYFSNILALSLIFQCQHHLSI